MPLRLDVKRKLTARSDRVKSVDLHPTEPWMLASLYNGNVHVWHIESQQLVKSFEVCDLPVRASKFVARKNWVVTGSDDMQVRVFNYNTLERIHQFEAHSDYVRCIAVHPTQPFILTCSDDMTIKLWNWDKKWSCQQIFEGHSHYVMQIVINPKDNNTFASASLDRTVKVWQLGSPQPNFTLEGHQRGVNCVDYYHGGDKPYLISGADDSLVKIWDYQNKTCVQTLEGHSQNVSSVCFHPELPIILTGSEDCTVRIWHANTYRLENTLNYGLDRVWCITALKGINNVCFGYDEGSVMVKLGREEPAMSMDVSGKIVWAKHAEIQQANLKAMGETEVTDGERLPLALKDLGACDIYPQTIAHNPNGRFVVVCGDGEYIIYTAMALRNKAFGPALEFVWALDSSEYAIRESNFTVKLFKNFKEKKVFKPDFGCEGIFGGYLLGCRSSATGLAFYDWETQELVRRIEIQPRQVFWSENGDYVCIATDDNYFILKYSCDAVTKARETKEGVSEDGVEDAFDVVSEVQETVKTGRWVGDCFIYTNSVNRLNYYVGGEIVTVAHLDRTLYLLGYIPKDNRLYLGDKELNVVSYELLLSVLEYQTAVMRRDFETADRVLPTIPPAHRTRVAHFLEKQGFKQQALAVSTDPEHRFDLALSLGELEVCYKLASEAGSEHKWRLVADLAQQRGDLEMAQACLLKAHDYPGLLLQATSSGNGKLIQEVGVEAETQGRNNVAFLSYFITGQLHKCLDLLLNTKRIPEAAFFARTYLPSEMSRVVQLWKDSVGGKIGQSLADPDQYDNLFPGLHNSVKTEQFLAQQYKTKKPSVGAVSTSLNHERNAVEEMLKAEAAGTFVYVPPVKEGDDAEFVDAPQQLASPQAEAKEVNLLDDEDLVTSIASKPSLEAPEEPVLTPSIDTLPVEQEAPVPPPVEEICPPPVQVPEALATTPVVVHEGEDLIKEPATTQVVDEDDDELRRDPVPSLVLGEGSDLGKVAAPSLVVDEEDEIRKDPALSLVVDEEDEIRKDPALSLVVDEEDELGKDPPPSLVVDEVKLEKDPTPSLVVEEVSELGKAPISSLVAEASELGKAPISSLVAEASELGKVPTPSLVAEEDELGKNPAPSTVVDEEDELGKDSATSLVVDEDNELWKDPAPSVVVDEDDELRKDSAPSFVVDEEDELRKDPTSFIGVDGDDKSGKDSGPSLLVEESLTREPGPPVIVEDDLRKEAAPPVVVSEEDVFLGRPVPPTLAEDDLLRGAPPTVAEPEMFRSPAPPTLAEAVVLKNPASSILAEGNIPKDPLPSTHDSKDVTIRAENQFLEDDWGSDDGLEYDGSKMLKEEGQGLSMGKLGEFQGAAPQPSSCELKTDLRLEEEQLLQEEEDIWGADEDLLEEDLLKEEKVSQSLLGASSGIPSIDSAQLERELELDLKNVRLEDHLDTADVNLDEEDLLAD